ncbi:putative transcriptional regulator [Alphaproteobacteria bacterium]
MNNLLYQQKSLKTLEGKFLIASPHLDDAYFGRSIIYICAHDESGAIGIIINQQIGNVAPEDLLKNYTPPQVPKLNIGNKKIPVLFGGPINTEIVVALSITKQQELSFTRHQKVNLHVDMSRFLKEFVAGKTKPSKFILVRGVSAWDSAQLEGEIAENSWFIVNPSIDLLFSQRIKHKWDYIMKELGILDFNYLVHYSGSA